MACCVFLSPSNCAVRRAISALCPAASPVCCACRRAIVACSAFVSPSNCCCQRVISALWVFISPSSWACRRPISALWAASSPAFAPACTLAKLASATRTSCLACSNAACKRSRESNIATNCPACTRSPCFTSNCTTRDPSIELDADTLITSPWGSRRPNAVTDAIAGAVTTGASTCGCTRVCW